MALNTITPSNREEEYLSAIAGDAGASAPVPSNRREEWLRRIAEGQGDQTDRLDHIEDQIPVDPTAEDVGKVMTVVEDTSGETPVYKWSAENKTGGGYVWFRNSDLATGTGNHKANEMPNDFKAAYDELCAEIYALASNSERAALIKEKTFFTGNFGLLPNPTVTGSGPYYMTIKNSLPSCIKVSGVLTPVIIENEFQYIIKAEYTGTDNIMINRITYRGYDNASLTPDAAPSGVVLYQREMGFFIKK